MNEQKDEFEFDVEGHRVAAAEGAGEDTEGHRVHLADGPDEDVEGHRVPGNSLVEDDEDVEGHRFTVQPPRDTDLGGTDR